MVLFLTLQVSCHLRSLLFRCRLWAFCIGDIVALMGFGETVIALSKDIVWLLIALQVTEGVSEGYGDFLEG